MLKTIFLPVFLLFASHALFADDAPIATLPGGNVIPVNQTDIQLYGETIDIFLFPGYYRVEVNYTFINRGKEQTVNMGFPSNKETKVMDFKASVNGDTVPTQTKPGNWDFTLKSTYIVAQYLENPINAFECFAVSFKAGETKHINNTYRQYYTDNYRGGRLSFFYILKTGSLWKDKIESIDVRLHTENAPEDFMLSTGHFNDSTVSLVNFKRRYTHIDPQNDLFFSVDIKFTKKFMVTGASSELKPTSKYSYEAANVEDGNTSTAWVEGVAGYGIGETLNFYTNCGYNSGVVTELDSIGFVNGLAKNQTLYRENSRVKQFLLTSLNDDDNDKDFGKKTKILINLNDTTKMQLIKFKTPIRATGFELKIMDVYKGDKYDDTAVSEVVFYVRQDE